MNLPKRAERRPNIIENSAISAAMSRGRQSGRNSNGQIARFLRVSSSLDMLQLGQLEMRQFFALLLLVKANCRRKTSPTVSLICRRSCYVLFDHHVAERVESA